MKLLLIKREHISTELTIKENEHMRCTECSRIINWHKELSDSIDFEETRNSNLIEGTLFGNEILIFLCDKHKNELTKFLINTCNYLDYKGYYQNFIK